MGKDKDERTQRREFLKVAATGAASAAAVGAFSVSSAVAESGVVIEINTAGLYKDVEEIYPAPLFLQLAFEAGVPLTINSDAHAPEEVGASVVPVGDERESVVKPPDSPDDIRAG